MLHNSIDGHVDIIDISVLEKDLPIICQFNPYILSNMGTQYWKNMIFCNEFVEVRYIIMGAQTYAVVVIAMDSGWA